MAEYIEREALVEDIQKRYCDHCDKKDYWCRACWVDDMVGEIELAPSADVAPVVHGRWRTKYPLMECQSCGEIYSQLGGNGGKAWNYCPNCGAKMDGE